MKKEKLFMDEFLEDRIYDAAIIADFVTTFHKDYVYFASQSPCGEDIGFEVYKENYTFDDIFEEVMSNFKYFDVDEHATMWYETNGKSGAPTDLRTLLNDAQDIKNMYGYLYMQMYNLKKELEEE
jgi:hypothetical protein